MSLSHGFVTSHRFGLDRAVINVRHYFATDPARPDSAREYPDVEFQPINTEANRENCNQPCDRCESAFV